QAKYHGLRPTIETSCSSDARSAAVSAAVSVVRSPADSAIGRARVYVSEGARRRPHDCLANEALLTEAGEIDSVEALYVDALLRDRTVEELREDAVRPRGPRSFLHDLLL